MPSIGRAAARTRALPAHRRHASSLPRERAMVDFACCATAWMVALAPANSLSSGTRGILALAVAASTVALTFLRRGYSSVIGVGRMLGHQIILRSCLSVGSAVIVVDLVAELGLGIGTLALSTLLATAAVQVGRLLIDRREEGLRHAGRLLEPVLVLGDGAAATELIDLIGEHPTRGWTIVGLVGDCNDVAAQRGLTHVGSHEDIRRCIASSDATAIVATADALQDEHTLGQLLALRREGLDVHVHAGLRGLDHREVRVEPLGHDTLIYLDHPRLLGCQQALKRVLDVVVASTVLVVTAPILCVTALAIKVEDRGPVLYRQRRVGRDGVTFLMPKLRSMQVDADRRRSELEHLNERDGGPLFKIDADPRVTRVGRLIRALSIDELPQLVSVIEGQMSLIGPRPALPTEVAQFDARLASRHGVRPGLTGLWQVEQRDTGSFEAYRRLDLYYVENWSLLLDLTILVHTVPAVVSRGWRSLRSPKPLESAVGATTIGSTTMSVDSPSELMAS